MRHGLVREVDPVFGTITETWVDSSDGKVHIRRYRDVQDDIDANVREYNSHSAHAPSRYGSGPMHKIASIPREVVEKWFAEGFNFFTASDDELRRKLRDPDWKKLRTMPGKI